MQATEFKNFASVDHIIDFVGPLFSTNHSHSGVLASISMAQFILESDFGRSTLAELTNNCFGMKSNLSGNNWSGSTWKSGCVCAIETTEFAKDGEAYQTTENFRVYSSVEESIADHSAYLIGAMRNGAKPRYEGIAKATTPAEAAHILVVGGYATAPTYEAKLLDIIKRYDLERFDVAKQLYRVRRTWGESESQIGAFHVLDYAIEMANHSSGYCVFDSDGVCVYPSHLDRARYWAAIVYDKIVTAACSHRSGAHNFEEIAAMHATTCNSAVAAVLIKAGVLKPDCRSFGHTTKDGKNGETKTSPELAIKGLSNLIPGTYDLVRVDCLFKDLGSKYQEAGCVYFQDSNACISAGDGWVFSAHGGSAQISKTNGQYVKTMMKSGYPFNHKILYVLIPS